MKLVLRFGLGKIGEISIFPMNRSVVFYEIFWKLMLGVRLVSFMIFSNKGRYINSPYFHYTVIQDTRSCSSLHQGKLDRSNRITPNPQIKAKICRILLIFDIMVEIDLGQIYCSLEYYILTPTYMAISTFTSIFPCLASINFNVSLL